MVPVLICALIALSSADNDLDSLYPELEHSRTIYVTGERSHHPQSDDATQSRLKNLRPLFFAAPSSELRSRHSLCGVICFLRLSGACAAVGPVITLLCGGLLAQGDTAICSAPADEILCLDGEISKHCKEKHSRALLKRYQPRSSICYLGLFNQTTTAGVRSPWS